METSKKEIQGAYLRINSPEIRKRIENAGISVCVCAGFKHAVWLSCSSIPMDYDVHGVGYDLDEMDPKNFSIRKNLEEFQNSSPNYVDCGFHVGRFIQQCKQLKKIKEKSL